MNNNTEQAIKKLRELEAYAKHLGQECYNTRKMLEADSSASSTREGHIQEVVAMVVGKRNLRLAAKAAKVQQDQK